jgi:hypothetical protein
VRTERNVSNPVEEKPDELDGNIVENMPEAPIKTSPEIVIAPTAKNVIKVETIHTIALLAKRFQDCSIQSNVTPLNVG